VVGPGLRSCPHRVTPTQQGRTDGGQMSFLKQTITDRHTKPSAPVPPPRPLSSHLSLQNRRMKWKKENKTKLDGPDMDESPESN
jgi:hypothetical protein